MESPPPPVEIPLFDLPPRGDMDPDEMEEELHGITVQPPEDVMSLFADLEKPLETLDVKAMEEAAEISAKINSARANVKLPPPLATESSPAGSNTKTTGKKDKKKGDDNDEKKERKRPANLTAVTLIQPNGFPRLIAETRHFKIKGKGHEIEDLNRLMKIYQYWVHQLHPKDQFKDSVDRIEKICHTKQMNSKLKGWHEELNGKIFAEDDSDQDDVDPETATKDRPEEPPQTSPTHSSSRASVPSSPNTKSRATDDDSWFDNALSGLLDNGKSTAGKAVRTKKNTNNHDDDETADWLAQMHDEAMMDLPLDNSQKSTAELPGGFDEEMRLEMEMAMDVEMEMDEMFATGDTVGTEEDHPTSVPAVPPGASADVTDKIEVDQTDYNEIEDLYE